MIRRVLAVAAAITMAAGILTATAVAGTTEEASAADGRDFNPGYIISDALFFDGGAMNEADVQAFLNGKVTSCVAGYTCLKSYHQATQSKPSVDGRCSAYTGSPDEMAASIIAKVGAACGISQKAILVLLEKEQGLVSDTWPTAGQYRSATGYGCPDTAACDSTYYGFFNQVYMAALQFKRYAASPTSWNHIAGQVNTVRYNPNAACGSSQVFIQNQATAGLYNYTPYQPNAAALANLYGTGDGCSAYGNRNFWRMYSDWFGSPTGTTDLVRTTGNASVYVIAGTIKYPIPDEGLLAAYAPLGPVSYVSQSYLDRFPTQQNVGRVLRGPDGAIYFTDAGYALRFPTCTMVADYGGNCSTSGYVQLTAAQIAKFRTGPDMTNVLGTQQGARYYVSGAVKREILDAASQAAAGIPAAMNVLNESALSALPFGAPVARDSVVAQQRGTSTYSVIAGGGHADMDAAMAGATGAGALTAGSLWPQSIQQLTNLPAFNGIITTPAGTALLGAGRSYGWTATSPAATRVAQSFQDAFPSGGVIAAGSLVKSTTSSSVFAMDGARLRAIPSWAALLTIAPNPVIVSLAPGTVAVLPSGPPAQAIGSLMRTSGNPSVYVIDGFGRKVPLASFDHAYEAGFTGAVQWVDDGALDGYTTAPATMTYGVTCNGTNYVSAGGSLHPVGPSVASLYPFAFTALDPRTCAQTTVGKPATQFIRLATGSIYLLEAGQKRPVTSMDRYAALGGPAVGYLDVSSGFAAGFPVGPAA
jgi:hypothetical protein